MSHLNRASAQSLMCSPRAATRVLWSGLCGPAHPVTEFAIGRFANAKHRSPFWSSKPDLRCLFDQKGLFPLKLGNRMCHVSPNVNW